MRRRGLAALATVAALAGTMLPTGSAADAVTEQLEVAPVTRIPFPDRGYAVSLRSGQAVDGSAIEVRENGVRVSNALVTPLAASGLRFGVVLAIDASNSMAGEPFAAAIQRRQALRQRTAARGGARLRRVQRRGERPPGADRRREGADGRAAKPAGARVWNEDLRRARQFARSAARGEDLGRIGGAALRRRRRRQRASGRQGRPCRPAPADPHLHRRTPLRRLRPEHAADHRRRDGWRVRRGELRGGALGDLHRARAPTRGRVPRPLPVRREAGVARERPDRGGRRPGHGNRVRRADTHRNRAVPSVARLALRPLTALDHGGRALLRGAPLRAGSAARPRTDAEPRRTDRPLLHRGAPRAPGTRPRRDAPGAGRQALHAVAGGRASSRTSRSPAPSGRLAESSRRPAERRSSSSSSSRPSRRCSRCSGSSRPPSPRGR